ncbi:MAG: hypothetical protein AB1861_21845 [Cyanobacteriota bacterium]
MRRLLHFIRSLGTSPPLRESAQQPTQEVQSKYEALAIIYQTLVGIWDKEADRFWLRNNLFLLINGGLLAAFTTIPGASGAKFVISLFGIYFSALWALVNKKGAYYVHRWRPAIENFESILRHDMALTTTPLTDVRPDPEVFVQRRRTGQWFTILFDRSIPAATTTELMRWAILGFLAAWVVLFTLNIIELSTSTFFANAQPTPVQSVITSVPTPLPTNTTGVAPTPSTTLIATPASSDVKITPKPFATPSPP